jgi:anti-sigma-K factor RskA
VALSTAAAAIVLGAWAFSLHESLARERAARAAEARIAAVLSSPGARRYPLIGAHGTLAVAPDGGAVLAVSSLSEAPRGKSYEAWVVARGVPQPAGVFSGGGAMTIALTRPVLRGARVAVSLERAGGVPRLTGTLLFGAQTA